MIVNETDPLGSSKRMVVEDHPMILYKRIWNEHENDDWPGQYEYQKFIPDYEAAENVMNRVVGNPNPVLVADYWQRIREVTEMMVNAALGIEEDTE